MVCAWVGGTGSRQKLRLTATLCSLSFLPLPSLTTAKLGSVLCGRLVKDGDFHHHHRLRRRLSGRVWALPRPPRPLQHGHVLQIPQNCCLFWFHLAALVQVPFFSLLPLFLPNFTSQIRQIWILRHLGNEIHDGSLWVCWLYVLNLILHWMLTSICHALKYHMKNWVFELPGIPEALTFSLGVLREMIRVP